MIKISMKNLVLKNEAGDSARASFCQTPASHEGAAGLIFLSV